MGNTVQARPKQLGLVMFDAHCHVDRCIEDPHDVITRAQQAGVTSMLVAGVDPQGWLKQNTLAAPGVLMSWGLHPWAVSKDPSTITDSLDVLRSMLSSPPVSVYAVGEMGLDHGRRIDRGTHQAQEEAFRAQLRLARESALPVVLHVVSAHQAAIQILRDEGIPACGGMVHAYSGSAEQVPMYLDLGLHLSFCAAVTNPHHRRVREAIKRVPADRLLVETDAPDQTPMSRRPAPNEPAFLIDVISAAAELRGADPLELATITTANAEQLFCREHR